MVELQGGEAAHRHDSEAKRENVWEEERDACPNIKVSRLGDGAAAPARRLLSGRNLEHNRKTGVGKEGKNDIPRPANLVASSLPPEHPYKRGKDC